MKKSITAVVTALIMMFSIFGLTACGHEHTFSDEWSTSATEHWHAATCEHTDEVKDKGEHEFGGGGSCSVCGYVKPDGGETGDGGEENLADYKVTEAQWKAALAFPYATFTMNETMYGDVDDATGERYKMVTNITLGASAYSVSFDFVTLYISFEGDDVWVYYPIEMMQDFMSADVSESEDEELTYAKVEASAATDYLPEGISVDFDAFKELAAMTLTGFTTGAKENFDKASFDADKNAYILTGIDYEFENPLAGEDDVPEGNQPIETLSEDGGEGGDGSSEPVVEHVYGASYEIKFENGKMVSFKETFYNDAEHSESGKVEVEITDIDSTVIKFPETVSVTEERYNAAFDDPWGDNVTISFYDSKKYATIEFDSGKFHMYQMISSGEGNYSGGDMYTHFDGNKVYSYVTNTDNEWEKKDITDQNTYSNFAEFVAYYKQIAFDPFFAFAADEFDSANVLGNFYVLPIPQIDGYPVLGEDEKTVTVYNVVYVFTFDKDSVIDLTVLGSYDEENTDTFTHSVTFGAVEIFFPDESEPPAVDEDTFKSAIDNSVSDNFGVSINNGAVWFQGELGNGKVHQAGTDKDGDSYDFYAEYFDGNDEYYNYYSYDSESGKWTVMKTDFHPEDENEPKSFAENAEQFKTNLINPTFVHAKNAFGKAFWRDGNCEIKLDRIDNFEFWGNPVIVYNAVYNLYFNYEDGTLAYMNFKCTLDEAGTNELEIYVAGIGTTEVTLPTEGGEQGGLLTESEYRDMFDNPNLGNARFEFATGDSAENMSLVYVFELDGDKVGEPNEQYFHYESEGVVWNYKRDEESGEWTKTNALEDPSIEGAPATIDEMQQFFKAMFLDAYFGFARDGFEELQYSTQNGLVYVSFDYPAELNVQNPENNTGIVLNYVHFALILEHRNCVGMQIFGNYTDSEQGEMLASFSVGFGMAAIELPQVNE